MKAANAGCDAVIADLEDAVAEEEKNAARDMLVAALEQVRLPVPAVVRINGVETEYFERDLEAVAKLKVTAVIVPKAIADGQVLRLRESLPKDTGLIALIETPRGLADVRILARQYDRIAFGSIDFSGSLGASHSRESLLVARSELVLAAALCEAPAPIDGVTVEVSAIDTIEDDARYAASLGFGGKLLIHPAQVQPALAGFAPQTADVDRARRLLASMRKNAGRFEGKMVDKPVVVQAQRIIAAYENFRSKSEALKGRYG